MVIGNDEIHCPNCRCNEPEDNQPTIINYHYHPPITFSKEDAERAGKRIAELIRRELR